MKPNILYGDFKQIIKEKKGIENLTGNGNSGFDGTF